MELPLLLILWCTPLIQCVPITPVIATESFVSPVIEEVVVLSEDSINCSCVRVARSLNDKIPLIDAKDFVPNILRKDVKVGDFILENFNGVAHVALIGDIQIEGYFIKGEGNFKKCKFTEGRIVPYDSGNTRGFFRP